MAASPLGAAELTVRITQTGNLYVQEPVATAIITLAIPQNSPEQIVQKFSVEPATADMVKDAHGNTMLRIRFSDLRTGVYNYTIETIVTAKRRDVANLEIAPIAEWLAETEHVMLTDRIREVAWRYRGAITLSDAARIAMLADATLQYDSSSKPRTSQSALYASKGDSLAHAVLLAALLRSAGVPARIAIGDAWLPPEQKMSNHAWVEVPGSHNGSTIWMPFDAAFLRSGPSAAYIAKWTGADLPPERIEFFGAGDASWQPNPDRVEILDIKSTPQLVMEPLNPGFTFPRNLYGWLGVTLKPKGCGFWHLLPLSCLDQRHERQPMLEFHQAKRVVWACNDTDVIWTFGIAGTNYICPVRVDEETGASTTVMIAVNNAVPVRNISLHGPAMVAAETPFSLEAAGIDPIRKHEMLLYSPTLNSRNTETVWPLSLAPGIYDFYLWFDGTLANKLVRIVEQRAFAIALTSTDVVAVEEPFQLRVDVTNLLDKMVDGTVKLKVNNLPASLCWRERNATLCSDSYVTKLSPHASKTLEFTIKLERTGSAVLTASVESIKESSAAFVSKTVQSVVPAERHAEKALRAASKMAKGAAYAILLLLRLTLGIAV
ncbi:MAG: transglutaminase domain-containing protein [Candidatus Aenigmatarchaeota archaeon]